MDDRYPAVPSNGVVKPQCPEAVLCRLPPHLYEKLRRLAASEGRSLASMIRHLIAKAPL